MPNRIVFSDPSFSAVFTPIKKSDTSLTVTQFAPQIYSVQKSEWSEAAHQWIPSKEIVFRNPKQNHARIQQRYSELRSIAWTYLTGACIISILTAWIANFFLPQKPLSLRGITLSLTTHAVFKASTVVWTFSVPLIWCVTKVLEMRNTPQDPLTTLEQKLRFAKYKKDASAYAAVVSVVASCIGIYLCNVGRFTLRGSVYSATLNQSLILTAGPIIATFLTIRSYDQNSKLCQDHAFDLAAKVLSASDDALVPAPLIERKDYV